MCFSAEASFALSAILLPAGAYCVRSAIAKNKALLGLAVIPLAFSAQQLFEGLVWRGIERNDPELARKAAFAFLFFALTYWPFWIPFCASLPEGRVQRRRLLGLLAFLGSAGGLTLYLSLLLHPEALELEVRNHSVYYDISQAAAFRWMPIAWFQFFYVVLVGIPLLIAPARGFAFFGIALIVSATVSQVVYWYAFTSVWCFFAALLSLYLCFSFWRLASTGWPTHARNGPVALAG